MFTDTIRDMVERIRELRTEYYDINRGDIIEIALKEFIYKLEEESEFEDVHTNFTINGVEYEIILRVDEDTKQFNCFDILNYTEDRYMETYYLDKDPIRVAIKDKSYVFKFEQNFQHVYISRGDDFKLEVFIR